METRWITFQSCRNDFGFIVTKYTLVLNLFLVWNWMVLWREQNSTYKWPFQFVLVRPFFSVLGNYTFVVRWHCAPTALSPSTMRPLGYNVRKTMNARILKIIGFIAFSIWREIATKFTKTNKNRRIFHSV